MRLVNGFLLVFLLAFAFALNAGCGSGSNQAEVAPRTAEEVEAYKADVYAAEEEDEATTAEEGDE